MLTGEKITASDMHRDGNISVLCDDITQLQQKTNEFVQNLLTSAPNVKI